MADQDDLYLENLDEYVNDENKIVTYKGLSNLLKVPANKSKKMLQNFVDQQLSKGVQLNITFLVGGRHADSGKGYKFLIATKDNLDDLKKTFSQVTCCHIYSVQKAQLKNFEVLHGTDYDVVKESLFELHNWSSIYCPEAKQNDAALQRRQKMQVENNLPNGVHGCSKKTPESAAKEVPAKQSAVQARKQVSSASFFGANSKKQRNEKSSDQRTQESDNKGAKIDQKEKKDVSFFGKSAQAPIKSNYAKEEKGKEQKSERSQRSSKSDDTRGIFSEKEENERLNKETMKKKKGEKEAKSKGSEDSPGNEKTTKKDKELKGREDEPNAKEEETEIQESDSDDDFESFIKVSKGEEDNNRPEKKKPKNSNRGEKRKKEQVLEFEESSSTQKSKKAKKQPKDEETSKQVPKKESFQKVEDVIKEERGENNDGGSEIAPSGPDAPEEAKPHEKRRIRRKVLKSKTFMNDEGYMVTEKVYESESASEGSDTETMSKAKTTFKNDALHKKPREITAENKKFKAQASKNKNQSSLMSFFKKK